METEKVIGATVYLENDTLHIEYSGDLNKQEILYFLESVLKVEREVYLESFKEK